MENDPSQPQGPNGSGKPLLSENLIEQTLRGLVSDGHLPVDSKRMTDEILQLYVKLKVEEETRVLREQLNQKALADQREDQRMVRLGALVRGQDVNPVNPKIQELENRAIDGLFEEADPDGSLRRRHLPLVEHPARSIEEAAARTVVKVVGNAADSILPDLLRSLFGLGESRGASQEYYGYDGEE